MVVMTRRRSGAGHGKSVFITACSPAWLSYLAINCARAIVVNIIISIARSSAWLSYLHHSLSLALCAGEPKDHEKAEGLMQYSPHLPLRHSWMLNHDRSVSRLHTILSVPTSFESTTLVAAVGEWRCMVASLPIMGVDLCFGDPEAKHQPPWQSTRHTYQMRHTS